MTSPFKYPKEPYIGDDMHPLTEADWDPNWDAWKKSDAVRRLNTKTWELRADIRVDAMGTERGVRLTLSEDIPGRTGMGVGSKRYIDTGARNISTMRELAQAILDACDFVEEKNPTWANKSSQEKLV